MSKKLIVTLSIVFGIVVVLLILFWTLFALSSVSVNFKSTTQNLVLSEEEIVEAGQFRYGSCVLFEGKKKSINKINAKVYEDERFAYLRVVNIETVFPNKFVIHVSEREELFAVENDGQVLICDRDFRVLRKVEDLYESTQSNAIYLQGLKFDNKNLKVGDFLNVEQNSMKKFYSIMLQNNRDLNQQLGKFKEIKLDTYEDELTKKEYTSMTLTTFQNRKFVVNNIDFALGNKIQKLFAVESSIYSQNVDSLGNITNSKGETIYVVKSKNGEYISYEIAKDLKNDNDENLYHESDKMPLTYQILAKCYIKIDNLTLTDYVERTEEDIYYSFVEDNLV